MTRLTGDFFMTAEKLQTLLPLLERTLGHRPSPATVWRWCHKGVKANGERVRLRSVRIGGKVYATVEDVQRFITAQNPTEDQDEVQPDLERSAETTRQLESAGLL